MKTLLFLLACVLAPSASFAAALTVTVADEKGGAVDYAVIALAPKFEMAAVPKPMVEAQMRQQGTQFVPFVLPVSVGTEVFFPNMDEFRHQVYSFSKPKPFELRLYGQDVSNSVLFDKPGVVALGCNIHDNMLAYVFVSEHPIVAKTDASGSVSFDELATGDYDIYVWHPDMKGSADAPAVTVTVSEVASATASVAVELRSVRRVQLPPDEDDY